MIIIKEIILIIITIAVIITIIMIMVYSMEPTRWLFIDQNYPESYSSHKPKWMETDSNWKMKWNK